MISDWIYDFADYFIYIEYVTAVVALVIFISSLDDLFIDAWYWIQKAATRKSRRSLRGLTLSELRTREEQPLAIMIPAWQEDDVIAKMLAQLVAVLDYRNYTIFVGTYVNDPKTIEEVERMRRRYRHLVRVEVPNPGPTCKADCLNWVVQAILLHEKQNDREFAGVILHDSEDVLHPLELRLFNCLLPQNDMIQIPVWSLERRWHEFVAGTYMDEFAESHLKEMVARESMSGTVPSAGVGTCFSRRALVELARQTNNQPFNTQTLTEDYDIGERLGRLGMRAMFVHFPVATTRRGRSLFGRVEESSFMLPLSTREFFPHKFRAAYRQKARWILGISLLGWRQLGWSGSIAQKYMLFRDRKVLVTSLISVLAYLLACTYILFHFSSLDKDWIVELSTIFVAGSWPLLIVYANAAALVLRVAQRMYFVTRIYGGFQGLLSLPRMIVGNFINFAAVLRAWRIFLAHVLFGRRITWDKTMHEYPTTEALAAKKHRLGEILVAWQVLAPDQLDWALEIQRTHKALPLGRILLAKQWLDESLLSDAIAYQADLPTIALNATTVQSHKDDLPAEVCRRLQVLPIGVDRAGRKAIASARALNASEIGEVRELFGAEPAQFIACDSAITAALRKLLAPNATPQVAPDDTEFLAQLGVRPVPAFSSATSTVH